MKYGTDENDVEAVCREIGRLHDAGNRDELLEIVRELLSTALEDANKLAARATELQRTLYGRQSERVSPNQLDRRLPSRRTKTHHRTHAAPRRLEPHACSLLDHVRSFVRGRMQICWPRNAT